jgi:hypothetical protein
MPRTIKRDDSKNRSQLNLDFTVDVANERAHKRGIIQDIKEKRERTNSEHSIRRHYNTTKPDPIIVGEDALNKSGIRINV